jgi:outer membrane receptor protein involved in Fe transport
MLKIIIKRQIKFFCFITFSLLIFCGINYAQTTGKLKGKVTDSKGEPLIGANVLIIGTNLGAATDIDGYYNIINIRTGTYSVEFRFVGYQSKIVKNVNIVPDQSTEIDAQLNEQSVQTEAVTVTAQRPLVEFNQTSSIASVSKQEISNLPVQSLNDIVSLQAGVITDANGDVHFRGGRSGEVQYQVDGVSVNNPYDNKSTLTLDKSVIQEVQVISGTFDAKYGQAMSGVVNAVLRSGSERFLVSGEIYSGDYFTTDENRYPNNNKLRPQQIQNYQLTLSGPVPIPNTTFFISGRRYMNSGWLFGNRVFEPTDFNNFEERILNPTGDNKLIPLNTQKEWSGQFKIANQSFSKLQISYQLIGNYINNFGFSNPSDDFAYRLNPDGLPDRKTISISHGIDFTHTISNSMFYKINIRQNYFDYSEYKYKDVFDPRYLDAGNSIGDANFADGAIIQGVSLNRFIQKTNSGVFKGDFTWQVNRANFVEAGVEGQIFKLSFGSPGFLKETSVNGVQILQPHIGVEPEDPKVETYRPKQLASYLQDRIELGDLVVRAGLRLEYFDANAYVPTDLENPANSIKGAPLSSLKKTTKKIAVAPRLGFSFPLTASASIYFSYGHFYQMPGLGDLYKNSNYLILTDLQAGGITYGVMGNPDLKPQFTVQYEVGLKQALTDAIGLQLTFFYKDIRDLLGTEFVSTYTAAEYPRLTNVDFGSVDGITLSFIQRAIGPISTSIDYTLQFARGNSSDPRETSDRAKAGKDSRPRDVPFNWDQRHTLNASIVYYEPDDYSISAIIKYGSGEKFTPQIGPASFTADLQTNSGSKPGYVVVDLRAEKFFDFDFMQFSIFARVDNLFNEDVVNGFVFAGTGSPDYSLTPFVDRAQLLNPARYNDPRRIELGISFATK